MTNNNTPVDHINNDNECEHKKKFIQLEENDAVVTLLAHINYFQCQTTEVAECTARYNVLRKMMIVTGTAYVSYYQCQTSDENGTTAIMRLLCIHGKVVSVPAYINYFQNQSTEDAGPITRYYVLRNTKDTKSAVLIYGSTKTWKRSRSM